MKRKAPATRQTARKSTRGTLRLRSVVSTHFDEDRIAEQESNEMETNEAELNREELMTDDETTTNENNDQTDHDDSDLLNNQQDDQPDSNQQDDDGRETDEHQENNLDQEANQQNGDRSNGILQPDDQPITIDISEDEIVTQVNNQATAQNTQETVSSSQSEFIVSIDSETFLTPPELADRANQNNDQARSTDESIQQPTTSTNGQPNEIVELDERPTTTVAETGWISNETVHAFKYKFKIGSTTKIAAFDLDGTLITPKSKNKFSKDITDWKLLNGGLKAKIGKLIEDGYAFVIFSNQMGVSRKFITLKQAKLKFKNIVEHLNLPCIAFFCTHLDAYRKPSIGMLELYKTINGQRKLDLNNSFFVGDAMGRPKDHSAADLLFAYNCKLPFIPIEGFISGFEKPKLFTYDQLKKYRIPKFPNPSLPKTPRILAKACKGTGNEGSEFLFITDLIDTVEKFVDENSKSIILLLVGLFGSGKTFFFNNYLAGKGYKSIDSSRSLEDEQALFNSYVQDDDVLNKRIVIDQPNLTDKQRKRWIELAKKEGYEAFAIQFNLTVEQCLHLVRFRNYYIEPNRKAPTQTELIKQSLSLQEPRYDEGFRTVYKLDFFENFNESPLKENIQYYHHVLFDKP